MSIIFVLLPISIFLGVLFLAAYMLSVRDGQYEDLDTPAYRILADDLTHKEKK